MMLRAIRYHTCRVNSDNRGGIKLMVWGIPLSSRFFAGLWLRNRPLALGLKLQCGSLNLFKSFGRF